jgi:predicted dehydrogenase
MLRAHNALMPGETGQDLQPPVRVGVIGCGRMGRLHARTYAQLAGAQLTGVHDANPDKAHAVAKEFSTRPFDRLGDLLDHVDGVTIAVPTQHHLEVAEPCLARDIACLIEKPLATDIAQGRRIAELARARKVIVQVGHIERFNPAIRALQHLDIRPQFMEVERISPMTFRSIDVGVVLDLMIHDIDIVLKLAGAPVQRLDASGVSVIGGVEDICNARLTFANGCVANLTASRLALKTERKMRIFSSDAYVSLDYQKREGVIVRRSGNLQAIRDAVERIRRGEVQDLAQLNFAEMVKIEPLQIEQADPLTAQAEAFVQAVRAGTAPPVTLEDGLAALETATRIVEAIPPYSLG